MASGRVLIVGLGNPGPQYARNRHNVGFMVLDRLAGDLGIAVDRAKFKGRFGTGDADGRQVALLEPQTYMNLSGESVSPARSFFGVEPADILVIHDELDLPYGTLRLKVGGGHAGHNGLRSIIEQLGRNDFVRLRVGIGRPTRGSVEKYVLSDFAPGDEQAFLPDLIERGVAAVRLAIQQGAARAMNQVNVDAAKGRT
jgi:PTH1 family peptidyl-tRNA hydrolase